MNTAERKINVSVIGGNTCSEGVYEQACEMGRLIAERGWVVVCGGMGGVMEAVCKGAVAGGGMTVGIIPSGSAGDANPYVRMVIPTGWGYIRNTLVASASQFIIAFPGEYGTLSEIAFALNMGKTVVGINTWQIRGVVSVATVYEAVAFVEKELAVCE